MIIVWNQSHGDMYGFPDMVTYKAWAVRNEGKERTCWEDEVYDIGAMGHADATNQVNMREFNDSIT